MIDERASLNHEALFCCLEVVYNARMPKREAKPYPKPEKLQPDEPSVFNALDSLKAIPLVSQVKGVKTNVDGGWSITLEGSGQLDSVMMFLAVAKRPGVIVESVNIFVDATRPDMAPEKEEEPENPKGIY